MKQLEKSAEKAVEREEKLKEKILSIQQKFKSAEGRCELVDCPTQLICTWIFICVP